MQAVVNRTENLSVVDGLVSLIEKLEYADNRLKSEIENKIVAMGASAVKFLVDALPELTGVKRGVATMSLIRIGEASVEPLKRLAIKNPEFAWVANYLIAEIVS